MSLIFKSLWPWLPGVRAKVLTVASDMAAADAEEIYGLRPDWHGPEEVTASVGEIMRSGCFLEGFVALREGLDGELVEPVAVALAWRSSLPHVADLALFGRAGRQRYMPAVYAELGRRAATFGPDHGLVLAEVPVLATHRAALKRLQALGGERAFDYGPIGREGQHYTHMIWRF